MRMKWLKLVQLVMMVMHTVKTNVGLTFLCGILLRKLWYSCDSAYSPILVNHSNSHH